MSLKANYKITQVNVHTKMHFILYKKGKAKTR